MAPGGRAQSFMVARMNAIVTVVAGLPGENEGRNRISYRDPVPDHQYRRFGAEGGARSHTAGPVLAVRKSVSPRP
jgi:hypothetical protein